MFVCVHERILSWDRFFVSEVFRVLGIIFANDYVFRL